MILFIYFLVKRKNIRKLMSNNKLTSVTREAQKAEKERRERIRKRNKSANDEGDDSGAANVPIVLESNEETTLEVRIDGCGLLWAWFDTCTVHVGTKGTGS